VRGEGGDRREQRSAAGRARTLGDRREFLRRCVGLGLSASTASLLLGCITKRTPPPTDEAAPSAAGPLEPELRIFNWSDYIGQTTVADFEREFGVRVSYDTFESNEELLAKLVAGGGGYDVICPTGYLVSLLAEAGMLQPLDHGVLSNWGNLLPLFAGRDDEAGARYAMPYQWGMTGVAYRTDLVSAPPDTWSLFADPALRGRLTMLDDGREVLGAMLRWRGHSLNATEPALLAAARQDALAIKPNLRAYISAAVKGQLISGDIAAAQLYLSDARIARGEEPRVSFAVPREGSTIYADYFAIPRDAPHRRAAHAFLNYVLRADVGAAISNEGGGGSPNAAALPLLADPIPPPDGTLQAQLEFQRDLGAATDLWDRMWTEVKAG
jgi:spermidine/putrescine-binding protein